MEKVYPWDMEQLRTLALLAEFPPDVRERILERGKEALESIEPPNKAMASKSIRNNKSIDEMKQDPRLVTMEDVEHLQYLDRIIARAMIKRGYLKVVDENKNYL